MDNTFNYTHKIPGANKQLRLQFPQSMQPTGLNLGIQSYMGPTTFSGPAVKNRGLARGTRDKLLRMKNCC